MHQPFLEVKYDPETNTAVSTYRCGETEEVIHYEGARGDRVKFTPETWPDYLAKLFGRSLPINIDGYGWVKYLEDAIAIGIPEEVYTKHPLRLKSDLSRSKVTSIIYERRAYDGTLLERKEIFNEEDRVWFSFDDGTLDIPEGMDPAEFGRQYADKILKGV